MTKIIKNTEGSKTLQQKAFERNIHFFVKTKLKYFFMLHLN